MGRGDAGDLHTVIRAGWGWTVSRFSQGAVSLPDDQPLR